MKRPVAIRGGWSRTPLPITPDMLVVDLGSGAFPNVRADLLCDRELVDNRHRAGMPVVVDRPLVQADATALPFHDNAIDFLIVSHLAEHIEDPDAFCHELGRVAKGGYIETPSPLADFVLDEDYHIWRVGVRHGVLEFRAKQAKPAWIKYLCDRVYWVFYSPQPTCEKPTWELPRGFSGHTIRVILTGLGAVLNRSGAMHTRLVFTPMLPLRWRIVESAGSFPRGHSTADQQVPSRSRFRVLPERRTNRSIPPRESCTQRF